MICEKLIIPSFKQATDVAAHRDKKILIMNRDFDAELTPEETEIINSLTTIPAIDKYCRKLLRERWKE